jgi:DNA repair protein RecO (recombination protein O)
MSQTLSERRVRVYPTSAIALKRMDYAEADRIITVFTPDYGKFRLIAKGVRRSTSRMAGHLELFSHAHLMLARGRELDLATQASTVEPFREVREDLVKTAQAYHMAELIDGLLEDRDVHAGLFHLFRDALQAMAEDVVPPEMIARHFELHFLNEVGFRPQLTHCVSCRAEIIPGANGLSTALGGVLCPSCAIREPTSSPIPVDVLKLLRYLQRTPRVADLSLRVPPPILKDAERIMRRQIEFLLERRLRAAEFVHRVAEATEAYRA